MSIPLQDGLWLLRRLRPLSCTLAFSRPVCGSSSLRVPQFRTNVFQQSVAASYTPGVRGLPFKEPPGIVPHLKGEEMRPTALSFWTKCFSHFHLLRITIVTWIQMSSPYQLSSTHLIRGYQEGISLANYAPHICASFHCQSCYFIQAFRFTQ